MKVIWSVIIYVREGLLQLIKSQTERVRGFSLAVHALWACRRPRTMTPPFWVRMFLSDAFDISNSLD